MSFVYNPKYFDGTNLLQLKPQKVAFKTIKLKEGIIIGLFQGKKGEKPELDFVIKLLRPGVDSRPEPPLHIYWVVDLILKIEKYKREVREIVNYYLRFYENAGPFNNVEERNNYELITLKENLKLYKNIEQGNTLSLEYVCTILELFVLCEKRNKGAYMFKELLKTLLNYIDGKADYMHVLKAAQPGYR